MKCGQAQHKLLSSNLDLATVDEADPQNVNVYIGNVASDVSDDEIWQLFTHFGQVRGLQMHRKGEYPSSPAQSINVSSRSNAIFYLAECMMYLALHPARQCHLKLGP